MPQHDPRLLTGLPMAYDLNPKFMHSCIHTDVTLNNVDELHDCGTVNVARIDYHAGIMEAEHSLTIHEARAGKGESNLYDSFDLNQFSYFQTDSCKYTLSVFQATI